VRGGFSGWWAANMLLRLSFARVGCLY
jgi:hypothetical protein